MMKRPQETSSHPLLVVLAGAFTTFVVKVFLRPALEETDIPIASLPTAILAGLMVGAVLLFATWKWNQWRDRADFREQQRRSDGKELKDLTSEIYDARLDLRRSLRPGSDLLDALNKASELFDKLRLLAIDGPDLE